MSARFWQVPWKNRAHFYAGSAFPLGDSISAGCTGVVFGTWGVSQETPTSFWWYRGYYSLNKCFSMMEGGGEGGVAVVEEPLCRFRKSHRPAGLTLKKAKLIPCKELADEGYKWEYLWCAGMPSKFLDLINMPAPNTKCSKKKNQCNGEPPQKICAFCSFANPLKVPALRLCDTKCKRNGRGD